MWGRNWPCIFFFFFFNPLLPPSLLLKEQVSFHLPWESGVHFPQALAYHMTTCLPLTWPFLQPPWAGRLASRPCIPLTFSRDFASILSALTGFLPLLFSSLQTREWDLTRPSVCLRRLYNLFSLSGKFNLTSSLTGGGRTMGPHVLFSKGYGAYICVSFLPGYPNLWLGSSYSVFWMVLGKKHRIITPQFISSPASRMFTFVPHTLCATNK